MALSERHPSGRGPAGSSSRHVLVLRQAAERGLGARAWSGEGWSAARVVRSLTQILDVLRASSVVAFRLVVRWTLQGRRSVFSCRFSSSSRLLADVPDAGLDLPPGARLAGARAGPGTASSARGLLSSARHGVGRGTLHRVSSPTPRSRTGPRSRVRIPSTASSCRAIRSMNRRDKGSLDPAPIAEFDRAGAALKAEGERIWILWRSRANRPSFGFGLHAAPAGIGVQIGMTSARGWRTQYEPRTVPSPSTLWTASSTSARSFHQPDQVPMKGLVSACALVASARRVGAIARWMFICKFPSVVELLQ